MSPDNSPNPQEPSDAPETEPEPAPAPAAPESAESEPEPESAESEVPQNASEQLMNFLTSAGLLDPNQAADSPPVPNSSGDPVPESPAPAPAPVPVSQDPASPAASGIQAEEELLNFLSSAGSLLVPGSEEDSVIMGTPPASPQQAEPAPENEPTAAVPQDSPVASEESPADLQAAQQEPEAPEADIPEGEAPAESAESAAAQSRQAIDMDVLEIRRASCRERV